jgi:hypothetical protein
MNIEISTEEKKFMGNILSKELEDTRVEVHRTKNHDYKMILKGEENMLRNLLDRLKTTEAQN